ncbi:hypothetical protein GCM10010203_47400 [Actinomadura yumaensis]
MDRPSHAIKLPLRPCVPSFVTLEFSGPEIDIRFRRVALPAAIMAVPEASMNEYRSATTCECKVWGARQVFGVKAKAVTKRMRGAADT